MRKMFTTLRRILLDDSGLLGLIGSGMERFGKSKQNVYDPYAGLRSQFQDYAGGQLGRRTPYQYNQDFEIDTPDIESSARDVVFGKLQDLPQSEADVMGTAGKYYDARKAQMDRRHQEEVDNTRAMYNRLGLVSSTPGLKAEQDLRQKQGEEFNTLESELMYDSIQKEMEALGLNANIANQYIGQARGLGETERAGQRYAIDQSVNDINRMGGEEQSYAQMIASLLSGNAPTTYFTPSMTQKIGGFMGDVEDYGMQMAKAFAGMSAGIPGLGMGGKRPGAQNTSQALKAYSF